MISILLHKKVWTVLLLTILLCGAFYDVVFLNKTFKVTTANSQALPDGVYGQENNKPPFIPVNGTDSPVLEEPTYEFIKRNLWRGILPLWNPHQACGYPLIGMIQTAIFYPLNIILYTLPSAYNWDILILIRLLLAGLLTFWFMKELKFRDIPALTAAIIFMLSGPMILLQYWTANVDILLPLVLLCFEKFIRGPAQKTYAFLALSIALTIFGGHPEHIFLVNIYGFIFFIFRSISLKGIKPFFRMLLPVIIAYIWAAAMAAIILFPFIRNFLTEFWHGHPAGAGLLMEEQLDRIITLALPHFFQKAPITFDWTFAGWWGGYLGTLPLALAFLGLFNKHKKGLNWFFGITAFIIIAKEYGMPVVNWLGYLPFFSLVRYAIHTPPLAAFSVAVLTGMGTRAVLARKHFLRRQALIFILLLAIATAINLYLVRHEDYFPLSLKAAGFAAVLLIGLMALLVLKRKGLVPKKIVGIILITAVFLELFSYIHRERPNRFDSFPRVPYIEMLKTASTPIRVYGNFWAFYPNTGTAYGVNDLGFFMGLAPKRFVHFVNAVLSPDLFRNNFRSPALRSIPIVGRDPFLDLLNVHYIIQPSDQRFIRPFRHFGDYTAGYTKVYDGEVRVFQRPNTFPRAFMVYEAFLESNEEKTFERLMQLRRRLQKIVVINSSTKNGRLETLLKPAIDASRIAFTSYTPNRVDLSVQTAYAGLLVMSDAYHPDWTAFIDGKKTEIYQTDYLLRSVFVPEGKHNITFIFRPFSFYAGAVVSLLAFLVWLGIFISKRS